MDESHTNPENQPKQPTQVRQTSPDAVVQPIDPFPQMVKPTTTLPAGKLIEPAAAPKRRLSSNQIVPILLTLGAVAIIIRVAIAHVDGTKPQTSASTNGQTTSNPLGLPSTQSKTSTTDPNSSSDQQIQSAESSCAKSPLTNC